MRHGASGRRSRNRGGNRRGNQNRTQVFDSNGPDVRIRGTAHQIHEKYMALAKDAAGAGDRIMEQSYLQHAEHYMRVINSWSDVVQGRVSPDADSEDGHEQETRRAPSRRRTSDNSADKPVEKAETKAEDDLGLPASILGADTKTEELEDA